MSFILKLKTIAMPLELLTIKDLNDFKAELLRELKQLLSSTSDLSKPKKILKSREVRAMLRISQGTLQSIPPAKYIQINLAVASSSAAAVLQFY